MISGYLNTKHCYMIFGTDIYMMLSYSDKEIYSPSEKPKIKVFYFYRFILFQFANSRIFVLKVLVV